jgi:hypothetical protein
MRNWFALRPRFLLHKDGAATSATGAGDCYRMARKTSELPHAKGGNYELMM